MSLLSLDQPPEPGCDFKDSICMSARSSSLYTCGAEAASQRQKIDEESKLVDEIDLYLDELEIKLRDLGLKGPIVSRSADCLEKHREEAREFC